MIFSNIQGVKLFKELKVIDNLSLVNIYDVNTFRPTGYPIFQ